METRTQKKKQFAGTALPIELRLSHQNKSLQPLLNSYSSVMPEDVG